VHFMLSVWLADGTVGGHWSAASPQVRWLGVTMAAVPGTMYLGFVVVMLLIVIVVYPAVWSKLPDRREAAQTVLDKILRTLVRALRVWRR
jgi:hypothetical protein